MKAKYKGDNGNTIIELRKLRVEIISIVNQITEFPKNINVDGIKCKVVESKLNDFIFIKDRWYTSTFPLNEDIEILNN